MEERHTLPFVLYSKQYVTRCYIDQQTMTSMDLKILRGYFKNHDGDEVLVHIPTEDFFVLHQHDPLTVSLFDKVNLKGFFDLPPWGPDLMRAWELISTLDKEDFCTITSLHGTPKQIKVTPQLIRTALNLPMGDITYHRRTSTKEEKRLTCRKDRPTFDSLCHQQVRLALQLHAQHFHMTHSHRYTSPELNLAVTYTLAHLGELLLKCDFAQHLLAEMHLAAESKYTRMTSKAKRKKDIYLGAVLMLTRIAYQGLDEMESLPSPVKVVPGIALVNKPGKTAAKESESESEEEVQPLQKKTKGMKDQVGASSAQESQEPKPEAQHEVEQERMQTALGDGKHSSSSDCDCTDMSKLLHNPSTKSRRSPRSNISQGDLEPEKDPAEGTRSSLEDLCKEPQVSQPPKQDDFHEREAQREKLRKKMREEQPPTQPEAGETVKASSSSEDEGYDTDEKEKRKAGRMWAKVQKRALAKAQLEVREQLMSKNNNGDTPMDIAASKYGVIANDAAESSMANSLNQRAITEAIYMALQSVTKLGALAAVNESLQSKLMAATQKQVLDLAVQKNRRQMLTEDLAKELQLTQSQLTYEREQKESLIQCYSQQEQRIHNDARRIAMLEVSLKAKDELYMALNEELQAKTADNQRLQADNAALRLEVTNFEQMLLIANERTEKAELQAKLAMESRLAQRVAALSTVNTSQDVDKVNQELETVKSMLKSYRLDNADLARETEQLRRQLEATRATMTSTGVPFLEMARTEKLTSRPPATSYHLAGGIKASFQDWQPEESDSELLSRLQASKEFEDCIKKIAQQFWPQADNPQLIQVSRALLQESLARDCEEWGNPPRRRARGL